MRVRVHLLPGGLTSVARVRLYNDFDKTQKMGSGKNVLDALLDSYIIDIEHCPQGRGISIRRCTSSFFKVFLTPDQLRMLAEGLIKLADKVENPK